jgi:hypothetical protein
MSRLCQEAILAGLARRLDAKGSWSGETHIQKAAYLTHELFGVPFDFDFILYKHGPFSFELRDELGSMEADRLLERQPQPPPYGPRFLVTERGHELEERLTQTMSRYAPGLDWTSERLGRRGVAELERLATALWVTRDDEAGSVEEVDRMIVEARQFAAGAS